MLHKIYNRINEGFVLLSSIKDAGLRTEPFLWASFPADPLTVLSTGLIFSTQPRLHRIRTTEIGRAMYTRNGLLPPPDLRPLGLVLEQGNNFYDPDVSLGAWAHSLLKEVPIYSRHLSHLRKAKRFLLLRHHSTN